MASRSSSLHNLKIYHPCHHYQRNEDRPDIVVFDIGWLRVRFGHSSYGSLENGCHPHLAYKDSYVEGQMEEHKCKKVFEGMPA